MSAQTFDFVKDIFIKESTAKGIALQQLLKPNYDFNLDHTERFRK